MQVPEQQLRPSWQGWVVVQPGSQSPPAQIDPAGQSLSRAHSSTGPAGPEPTPIVIPPPLPSTGPRSPPAPVSPPSSSPIGSFPRVRSWPPGSPLQPLTVAAPRPPTMMPSSQLGRRDLNAKEPDGRVLLLEYGLSEPHRDGRSLDQIRMLPPRSNLVTTAANWFNASARPSVRRCSNV